MRLAATKLQTVPSPTTQRSKEQNNNMTTESTIKDAITRSISHTEIVAVKVVAKDIAEALSEVNVHSEEYDHAQENDGSWDVWGIDSERMAEFRIRITLA